MNPVAVDFDGLVVLNTLSVEQMGAVDLAHLKPRFSSSVMDDGRQSLGLIEQKAANSTAADGGD
jgi:hypothetical protein